MVFGVCFLIDAFTAIYLSVSLSPKVFFFFLAASGLHCCARAFSSCDEWGLLFVAVQRLLISAASLV